jgi:hypothetical protein
MEQELTYTEKQLILAKIMNDKDKIERLQRELEFNLAEVA